MTVLYQPGYSLPGTDYPLTHARIAHSRNWLSGGGISGGDEVSVMLAEDYEPILAEDDEQILLDVQNSTESGYYANAPLNSLTYDRWQPTRLPSTWQYIHTSSATCDYCAIAAHTMGTNGNTLEVQYYTGSAWSDLITATAITSDEPIYVIFAQTSAQKWRIRLTNGTPPKVGVIKFGLSMQLPRPFFGGHTPIPFGRQTTIRSNRSDTGEYLGRSKQRVQLATAMTWSHLKQDWMRDNWLDFQLAVETEPFFIAWRPGDYGDVAFAQVDEVPQPQNMGIRDWMSVSMNIRARGYN